MTTAQGQVYRVVLMHHLRPVRPAAAGETLAKFPLIEPADHSRRADVLAAVHAQASFDVRLEWGETGARVLGPVADVIVIVDVLSFTTAVDVAVGRGATVFPYRHHDVTSADFAMQLNATLAVDRERVSPESPFSLSPRTLATIPAGTRLVLPSPNGSTITLLAAEMQRTVLAGCLRNASATASAARMAGGTVTVIASGERWPDGTLRPAFEDLIGAGAIISRLPSLTWSPEAEAAVVAFRQAVTHLDCYLTACVTGRELAALGFIDDVRMAAELDASATVPRFEEGAYRGRPTAEWRI
jgi:2-phosphosulfolactate phosphatase